MKKKLTCHIRKITNRRKIINFYEATLQNTKKWSRFLDNTVVLTAKSEHTSELWPLHKQFEYKTGKMEEKTYKKLSEAKIWN